MVVKKLPQYQFALCATHFTPRASWASLRIVTSPFASSGSNTRVITSPLMLRGRIFDVLTSPFLPSNNRVKNFTASHLRGWIFTSYLGLSCENNRLLNLALVEEELWANLCTRTMLKTCIFYDEASRARLQRTKTRSRLTQTRPRRTKTRPRGTRGEVRSTKGDLVPGELHTHFMQF